VCRAFAIQKIDVEEILEELKQTISPIYDMLKGRVWMTYR